MNGGTEGAAVQYRVTIGLGQDSVEPHLLEQRASTLRVAVGSDAAGTDAGVVVDPVKATVQLVLVSAADDALVAAQQALQLAGRVLQQAELGAPASILTVEAEAVPVPAPDNAAVRPHLVTDDGTG